MFVTLGVIGGQCPYRRGTSLLQAAWQKKQSRHSDTAQWSQKQLLRVQLMQHHQFLHLQLVLHHQSKLFAMLLLLSRTSTAGISGTLLQPVRKEKQ